ncbi:MAG TPA: DUF2231 domain-containing protein [Opitutaceae bacterium]|nr:DUF2231 domain-containing protein [Opitutaceae bacterium]
MTHAAEFLGRLHPLILHFPLALLILGAAAEGVRVFRDSEFLGRLAVWMFGFGAITAVLAAGSGWLLAGHEHIRSDERVLLQWHRWLGVATAAVSTIGWLWSVRPVNGPWNYARRIVIFASALLVIAAGYFGGELVWGRDWLAISEAHSGE